MNTLGSLDNLLIVSVIPYFLERDHVWFEENLKNILEARKTQIFWQENTLFLEKDLKIPFYFLLRKLDEMGYEKVWEVLQMGEFSQRGGIIDIFPINLNFAIRIEFLGNKIENIFRLPIESKEEKKDKAILKKKLSSQKFFSDLSNLKVKDYIVHLDHGIGIFNGYTTFKEKDREIKYYEIEYDRGDKLFVPVGLEKKLSRYIGFSTPKLSKLGSYNWIKTKRQVKEEAEKFAREILKIYAKREIVKRKPYLSGNSEMINYIKETCPFTETPDQEKTIKEIEKDLEGEKPMDRLVCGDVGFGKTEVALRAIIKVVDCGFQSLMLCPTTILAHQHYHTFKRRLEKLPIEIGLLTRLQSKKEQKETIKKIKEGKIDIVVGTHRALSEDVQFKNLGLLVIDDEHKFGVKQKERLKKLKSELDVLSLSATPIPRTLYLALSGFRNISLIQTPPPGRLPVKIFILPFSEKVIKEAIETELKRGGQVYYLHNRIENILAVKRFLENILPNVKYEVAHGRLKEKELVKIMEKFQNKEIDVLIATTIIEAGIDLPNVNTVIVENATLLGLAQAYQIKGRVGRSHVQAFAYFLYPSKKLTPLAKERLKALKEAEELNAGYKIALKDLELRGAGNILGKEQSGNVNKVGLNLYCQMLAEAIEKLKEK